MSPSADPTAALAALRLTLGLALVLFLPGGVTLALAEHRSGGFERLSLAAGASITLWPLALLWSSLGGIAWTTRLVWLGVIVLLVAAALLAYRAWRRPDRLAPTLTLAGAALAFIFLVAVALRIAHAQGLVAAPWVDGYHHTLITQITLETGGVPDGFRPYLPVDGFYYHYGFHALAAAVAWLSGSSVAAAVLWTGQALNALTVLAVYVLALRLTRHRGSAVLAAAVPAALYWFPAYYLTWGRYTQLAGLVALPTVWILATDGMVQARPTRVQVLAAACGGGLLLVHYRVFVFFLIGVFILLVYGLLVWRWAGDQLARLAAMSVAGVALAAPWLVRNLLSGVRSLSAASVQWFGGQPGVEAVPRWLFETHHNAYWIGMAAHGLAIGLVCRRRAAWLVAAFLLIAGVAVRPDWLGLATSWALPPFSLAISAFLPVAVGVALLADAGIDLGALRDAAPRAERAIIVLAMVLTAVGAYGMRDVLNPETVIVEAPDVEAARWIQDNTPASARFLISTAHWHLGTYRGLDGGYWLPLLANRRVSVPASFYVYGDPAYARRVTSLAEEAASGDALTDDEILSLMERTRSDHVYVGPANEGVAGKLSAERLRRHPVLEELYDEDGVHVFRIRPDTR